MNKKEKIIAYVMSEWFTWEGKLALEAYEKLTSHEYTKTIADLYDFAIKVSEESEHDDFSILESSENYQYCETSYVLKMINSDIQGIESLIDSV